MILAIETATEVCSVALVHKNKVLSTFSVNEKNVHSEKLMVLIDEVLKTADVTMKQLTTVAVSIGPGSFTGLRIGLSVAKGLAMALDIPIVPIPTLDGIAEEYRRSREETKNETFCAIVDAKRDESFFSFYSITSSDVHRLSEYSIKLKDEILSDAKDRNSTIRQIDCNAVSVGLLAERNESTMSVNDFSLLEPLYLRDFVTTVAKNDLSIEKKV